MTVSDLSEVRKWFASFSSTKYLMAWIFLKIWMAWKLFSLKCEYFKLWFVSPKCSLKPAHNSETAHLSEKRVERGVGGKNKNPSNWRGNWPQCDLDPLSQWTKYRYVKCVLNIFRNITPCQKNSDEKFKAFGGQLFTLQSTTVARSMRDLDASRLRMASIRSS